MSDRERIELAELRVDCNELTADYDALLEKIEVALEIIKDLADLHDSYIGYLSVHNNYNEPAAKAISERITTLRNDVAPLNYGEPK